MHQLFTEALQARKEDYPRHLYLSANHSLPTMSYIYTFKISNKAETKKMTKKKKTLLIAPIAANLAPGCPHLSGPSVSLSLNWFFVGTFLPYGQVPEHSLKS